ncbi:hypothetical protein [Baekduia alba]|uniref:hypothetical protein n=1 Tax=Baekduia alba TaxID=2997333 RepID=UPI00234130AA|nr:hypothetical protein [Baekduia alba]
MLRIVERQCRLGDPVTTGIVTQQAGHRADRQLAYLLAKGYVVKPSKGNWLPAPGRAA